MNVDEALTLVELGKASPATRTLAAEVKRLRNEPVPYEAQYPTLPHISFDDGKVTLTQDFPGGKATVSISFDTLASEMLTHVDKQLSELRKSLEPKARPW